MLNANEHSGGSAGQALPQSILLIFSCCGTQISADAKSFVPFLCFHPVVWGRKLVYRSNSAFDNPGTGCRQSSCRHQRLGVLIDVGPLVPCAVRTVQGINPLDIQYNVLILITHGSISHAAISQFFLSSSTLFPSSIWCLSLLCGLGC